MPGPDLWGLTRPARRRTQAGGAAPARGRAPGAVALSSADARPRRRLLGGAGREGRRAAPRRRRLDGAARRRGPKRTPNVSIGRCWASARAEAHPKCVYRGVRHRSFDGFGVRPNCGTHDSGANSRVSGALGRAADHAVNSGAPSGRAGPVAVRTDRRGAPIGRAPGSAGRGDRPTAAALRAGGPAKARCRRRAHLRRPAYYGQVGSGQVTEDVAQAPLPLTFPHAWLGQSLTDKPLTRLRGHGRCVPALDNPEDWRRTTGPAPAAAPRPVDDLRGPRGNPAQSRARPGRTRLVATSAPAAPTSPVPPQA
jgi:hypothetical protein